MKVFKKLIGVLVVGICALFINVNAEEMSDEFKKYLNDDGKLIVKSIRVESGIEFVFEYLFMMDENMEYVNDDICWDIAEDMNSVKFSINCWKDESKKETHEVEIEYVYDKKIKQQIDGYMNRIPEDLKFFEVRDLEVVNQWVNGGSMIDYSSQFKEMFDYKNFKMDFRAGGGGRFSVDAIGNTQFMYNGTVYGFKEAMGVSAKNLIYIDESVADTKEAVVAAVQKRIDDYIGKDKVRVEFSQEGIYESFMEEFDNDFAYYQDVYNEVKEKYDQAQADVDKYCRTEEYSDENKCIEANNKRNDLWSSYNTAKFDYEYSKLYRDSFLEEWNKTDGEYAFLKEALNDWIFVAYVDKGEEGEEIHEFVVKRDSSKMIKPSVRTSDINTNIEISTNETLPLDTAIQAKKITSGEEYDKIVKILDLTDNITFDLKLYSSSTEKYITKLNNGEFEVKIPIPEEFKGKDLVVYYVNEDGKAEPFDVTPEGDYATFKTTHFSIYTLGYKEEVKDDNKVVEDNKNETNKEDKGEEVPKTFDGISASLVIGSLSLISLVGASLYLKKEMGK